MLFALTVDVICEMPNRDTQDQRERDRKRKQKCPWHQHVAVLIAADAPRWESNPFDPPLLVCRRWRSKKRNGLGNSCI